MKREDKNLIIGNIEAELKKVPHFYLTDISGLNAERTSALRRLCFERKVKLLVVKNKFFQKALERSDVDYSMLYPILKGSTSVIFSEKNNLPAQIIKEFRKKETKPSLKAAYVEESFYFEDNQLEALLKIKSKEELIGDVVFLLQSPMKKVVSQLKSGGNIIAGVVKTLQEKKN
jgi:large subunit ribosomal protein L10